MRDPAASAFERQFLAWVHIHLGVEPEEHAGTNAYWWSFPFEKSEVTFTVVGRYMNGAKGPAPPNDWLLRIEQDEGAGFVAMVAAHFKEGAGIRRRMGRARLRVQFKSTDLVRQFEDQTIGTGLPSERQRQADPRLPELDPDLQAVMESQFAVLARYRAAGNLTPFAAFMNDEGFIYNENIDTLGPDDDDEPAINRLSFRLRAALQDERIVVAALFFHAVRDGDNLRPVSAHDDEPCAIVGHFECRRVQGGLKMIWAYERSNKIEEAPSGWKYDAPTLWRSPGLPVLYHFGVRWFAPGDIGPVRHCAIDRAGSRGLVLLADGSAESRNLATAERSQPLMPPERRGSAHAIDAERRRMLQGELSGSVILHDFESGLSRQLYVATSGTVSSCALSADGRVGLAGTVGGELVCCDLEWWLAKHIRMMEPEPITACACTPDGTGAMTVSANGYTAIWKIVGGMPVTLAERQTSLVNARMAAVSANGRYAVAAGGHLFVVWDLERHTPGPLTDAGAPIDACAISPNGQFLVLGLRSGIIRLWDEYLGASRQDLNSQDLATAIAFAPDGGSVLVGHASGGVLYVRLLPA